MARRILFALPVIGCGAEVFVEIAAGLKRRGFEVDILAPLESRRHELDLGVRLHYYDVPTWQTTSYEAQSLTFHAIWGFSIHRELTRLERDYDVIFAHLPWGMASIYGYRRNRPLVGFIDASWSDYWDLFQRDPPEEHGVWVSCRISQFLDERAMRGCDRLIAPSRFLRDFHAKAGLKIDVIRHGRDPRWYRYGADRAALRARLGFPAGKKMVLIVGLEWARKGHHLFGELALRIRDEDVFFVAAGPQPHLYQPWLDRDPTLGGRLFIRPWVPHQEIPDYYASADLFVFPTFFEGFPLAPLEALASGTPVVAHRAASLPEEIDDGVEGYLVPPGDLDALEARVRELLADPARRRSFGEAARARFLREFTLERMIDEYETYFRDFPGPAA